ncbi:MAG TPA: histidinol-phosphate transaminase [Vicinamibacteria bacterium]|nr:histidinol-phosphate transaminase [Vicinamibacteria bacterium]
MNAGPRLSRRRFASTLAGAGLGLGLPGRAAASLPAGAPGDAIQLNANENPYGPSASALDALTRAQAAVSRYPDAAERRLYEAIAAAHVVAPEQVVLGCGSGEVLQMADMAFLRPGRTLVACEPTFEAVLGYAGVTGAETIKVPLTADFRHDLPRMLGACDERTGLVYVCNPNNPTGTLVGRDELSFFLERVPRSAVVLVDEAYHHFVDDPSYASVFAWLPRMPNLLVVRTFSKVHGLAGLRLGYGVGSRETAAAVRAHAAFDNANAGVLAAALASLPDEEHVSRQRTLNREARDWLCRELDKDARRYIPSHANFLMIDVGRDVGPVIEAFRRRDVLVGRRFPSMPGWLRVSIGTPPEMRAFMDALRSILAAG